MLTPKNHNYVTDQVKRSDGGYIDVPYMSDAVLVNLGSLMQQWTSDKYLATVSERIENSFPFPKSHTSR